jgi:hypothetical protein
MVGREINPWDEAQKLVLASVFKNVVTVKLSVWPTPPRMSGWLIPADLVNRYWTFELTMAYGGIIKFDVELKDHEFKMIGPAEWFSKVAA